MKFCTRKRREGFILAICLAAMLLVTVLTSVILLSVSVGNNSLKLIKITTGHHHEVSQLGERFLMGEFDEGTTVEEGYTCTVEGNVFTVTTETGRVVLIVETDDDGEKILRWNAVEAEEETETTEETADVTADVTAGEITESSTETDAEDTP